MSDYSWLLQIGFIVLFFFGPILFGIILPLLVAFLISRWLFAKSIPIKHFRWFFLTIVILTFTANIIWKIFISNHIYYEWDTILITPFTLLFHEAPVLDGMGTWIAEGWTLFKLDLLYYFMLGLLYVCSVIFLLIDPFSKFSKMQEKRSQFLKATIATTVLLFLFALIFPLIQPTLNNAISNFFPHIKPVERVENKTACTKPIQRNKVYFGGSDADYISADYKTFQKIWDKPGNSGFPSGVPSPDGSMIANPEFDGIWIKCTETDGLYKITMDQKKISGLDVSPQDLAGNISWSPDSRYFVLNYGGDLIKVDTETKEKTIVHKNVALRDFHIDPTKPRPSGFGSYYQTGDARWGKDNNIYYTKFLDNNKVELRRLTSSNQDEFIYTSDYPLSIYELSPNYEEIIVWETNWYSPGTPHHSDFYTYNLKTQQKSRTLYGKTLDLTFSWSDNGKYVLITNSGLGAIDMNNDFTLETIDLENNKSIDIKQKVKQYLKNHNLWKPTEEITVEFRDWSSDNTLLLYVFANNNFSDNAITLLADPYGDNIQIILNEKIKDNSRPSYLTPKSWL